MEKPILSDDFTIEDIHKLREYNYEKTKDLTRQEKMDYYNNKGKEFLKKLEQEKMQKKNAEKKENINVTLDFGM